MVYHKYELIVWCNRINPIISGNMIHQTNNVTYLI